jgi:uncharacterized membrane protein YphA (DoxX/SURF4 family)
MPSPDTKPPLFSWPDASTRLLYAIVVLRLAIGVLFIGLGYTHWKDASLTQELTSQWIDWTNHTPLFWLQDLYRWLVIPNASMFARLQTLWEVAAGGMVLFGLYHQVGVQLLLMWTAIHLLLVAHMQLPYLNLALMGLLLVLMVLWLADAGAWFGLDSGLRQMHLKRKTSMPGVATAEG